MSLKIHWTLAACLTLTACGEDAPETVDVPTCSGGKCDVIGDDDRREEFQGDVTDKLRETGRSTAIIVANGSMIPDGERTKFTTQTLADTYMLCPGEPFEDQPVTGFCSAWLVAPDTIMTNGHCIPSQQVCDTSSFVFDYAISAEGEPLTSVPTNNVYGCERIVAWDYTSDCDIDFAVIKLDRKVEDREPLYVRPSGDELDADNLVIIGHPFGLPRKYALNGQVVSQGSNAFTTTHDIIGGNSGSGVFDALTGEVQGLVTCGGSNFTWQYYNEGWRLDKKTGKTCDTTCDDEGQYTNGTWEGECTEGSRRRCVCDESGTQLVWEKRTCLSFENETEGQCSTENQYSQFSCETAPWLCPTPVIQHTKAFAHYTEPWNVYENAEVLTIAQGATVSADVEIADAGVAQAITVSFDLLGEGIPEEFPWAELLNDLNVTLKHGEESYSLVADGVANSGTAFEVSLSPGGATAFQVPFILRDAQLKEVAGTWTIEITNNGFADHTLHSWSVQAIIKPASQITDSGLLPCTEDCVAAYAAGPEPIVEMFEGDGVPINTDFVTGTLTQGWETEILDETGQSYEVVKTRRAQTMSLKTGEFALSKDFREDIGGRNLTIDYRYDGDGWFQVYADDHLLLAQQSFAQSTDTVTIPVNARKIRIILGATNDSQFHEATIYKLELSPAPPAQ